MKRWHKHAAALAIAATATAAAVYLTEPHHIGPAALYPDPKLSPGLIATSDFNELTRTTSGCGTYSQCHRATSSSLKEKIRAEYPNCPQGSEIDHIIPLALGGADQAENLWCQPADNEWNGQNYGYHTKDKLEAFLVVQMKAGKITPKAAQSCIGADWVKCYQQTFGTTPNLGGIAPQDPDTL